MIYIYQIYNNILSDRYEWRKNVLSDADENDSYEEAKKKLENLIKNNSNANCRLWEHLTSKEINSIKDICSYPSKFISFNQMLSEEEKSQKGRK